jgi:hypothetical protein
MEGDVVRSLPFACPELPVAESVRRWDDFAVTATKGRHVSHSYTQSVEVIEHAHIRQAKTTASDIVSEVAPLTRLLADTAEDSDGDSEHPKWLPVEYNMGGAGVVHGFIAEELVFEVR